MYNPSVLNHLQQTGSFNEEQWMHTLFLISDTQTWLDELQAELIYRLPVKNRKKLLCRSHYLTASALAHILERHYYKNSPLPQCKQIHYTRYSHCKLHTQCNKSTR